MPTVIYEYSIPLPASDKPHFESAYEILTKLLADHPEFAGHKRELDLTLNEFADGSAKVSVKIVNKEITRTKENIRVIFWLVVIAIILGLIAYA